MSVNLPEALVVDDGYLVAYTDGSCANNGQSNAKAGLGVWFYDHCPFNISLPVVGKATNIRAEIQASIAALDVINKIGFDKAKIYTDSMFSICCANEWIEKWKYNGWKSYSGNMVKNQADLLNLDYLCQKFDDIKWEHIGAHSGNIGNEQAHKLAKLGASKYKF